MPNASLFVPVALAALLALTPFADAHAQDAAAVAAANSTVTETLPDVEAQAGWLKLFDGATTFGWTADKADALTVQDGILKISAACTLISNTPFADYELKMGYRVAPGHKAEFNLLRSRSQSDGGKSFLTLMPGKPTKKGSKSSPDWKELTLRCVSGKWELNAGREHTTIKSEAPDAPAPITLQSVDGGLEIRSLKLRPLGEKPLFNGKDLTGWKVIPDHPSVYTVTPEGWLNVKNGNGEIQSESQWGDFVLQLDVFSNGDHLNSGVFFRELPGVFWGGYEDQIRNQWEGDDRTKAVDIGTGGLYFRQAARKVVASDRQWFTMSVIATGRHIAQWVNGYQTVDFQDTRDEADDARNGAKIKSGVIGLQGHDPTTDLSFRNIRILEYPK